MLLPSNGRRFAQGQPVISKLGITNRHTATRFVVAGQPQCLDQGRIDTSGGIDVARPAGAQIKGGAAELDWSGRWYRLPGPPVAFRGMDDDQVRGVAGNAINPMLPGSHHPVQLYGQSKFGLLFNQDTHPIHHQCGKTLWFVEDQPMNRLPVASRRGITGNFDQPGEDVLGNGCFLIIPNGPAEAQKLLDVVRAQLTELSYDSRAVLRLHSVKDRAPLGQMETQWPQ